MHCKCDPDSVKRTDEKEKKKGTKKKLLLTPWTTYARKMHTIALRT